MQKAPTIKDYSRQKMNEENSSEILLSEQKNDKTWTGERQMLSPFMLCWWWHKLAQPIQNTAGWEEATFSMSVPLTQESHFL